MIIATACTGGGGGTVTGPGSFQPSDTISASVTMSDGNGGTSSYAWIVLASTSGLCADAGASPPIDRKQQKFTTIALRDVAGATSTTPAAPGTYTIYPNTGSEPPKSASLSTGQLDATCQPIDASSASGESGTVTLTSLSGGVFAGSFDVTLNTGDHITGTFQPKACPQLQASLAAGNSHTCQ
jgi:hypothetical protein